MKIKIFQIDHEKDENRVRFMSYDFTEKFGGFNPDIYRNVFDGDVQTNDLEGVYRIFNTDERPETYHGSSLSVSDVVEVQDDTSTTKKGFYFCDSIGFKKVDFNDSQSAGIEDNNDSQDFTSLLL